MCEIRRVLKPGGILGARDADVRAFLSAPADAHIQRYPELLSALMRQYGGDPHIGSRLPTLVREAKFSTVSISASFEVLSTKEALRARAEQVADLFHGSFGQQLVTARLANQAEIEDVIAAHRRLVDHPDRFTALSFVEVVARRD